MAHPNGLVVGEFMFLMGCYFSGDPRAECPLVNEACIQGLLDKGLIGEDLNTTLKGDALVKAAMNIVVEVVWTPRLLSHTLTLDHTFDCAPEQKPPYNGTDPIQTKEMPQPNTTKR